MSLTRRTLAIAALAASAYPARAMTLARPLVIAHRGASGLRPEHTFSAYRLAVDQGADFIEPDLVFTKDGALVVRHENEIGGTTDVAAHPEFAARKTRKVIDGEAIDGWFTEDFTLAELKTLRARERLPQLRPESASHDGTDPIATFEEVVALARSESKRVGRTIGVYPEMKHPTHFATVGFDFPKVMAARLKTLGLDAADAPVFVQCFEVQPLKAIRPLTKAPLIQLVGRETPDMVTAEGLKAIAAYADGVGPDWSLVVPTVDGGLGRPTRLVLDAHGVKLKVHPWTVRAENYFLPPKLRSSANPAEHGDVDAVYRALFAADVDGLFSDFPGLEAKVRDAI